MVSDAVARRVVFVAYYYSPYVSGLTLHTRALAEGLAGRGWDVHVVCAQHDRGTRRSESLGGVHIHRVRTLGALDKGVVAPGLVPKALRTAGRSAVIVPMLPLVEAAFLSLLRPRHRVVPFYICDLRLGDSPLSPLLERAAHWSARISLRRSTGYAASSEDYARASRVIGRIKRRVVGVPPPVAPDRFVRKDAYALRAKLGLPHDAPVVGFVGRLVQEKGLPVLLEALEALSLDLPDVRLVIAGEGDAVAGGGMGPALRERAKNDEKVVFTGFLPDDDLPTFYSMLDVLALPSVDPLEAYGIVQVEAMLCGTPVVASDMPGVRIPVAQTGMGLTTPPGDPGALAGALRLVISARPEFVVTRATIERVFDSNAPVSALEELLESAMTFRG